MNPSVPGRATAVERDSARRVQNRNRTNGAFAHVRCQLNAAVAALRGRRLLSPGDRCRTNPGGTA